MFARRSAKRREVPRLLSFDPGFAPPNSVLGQELVEMLSEVLCGRLGARPEEVPIERVHAESSSTANSASQTTPR